MILELEPLDDIVSIRSRIDFAVAAMPLVVGEVGAKKKRLRLVLIVPYQNQALQSLVNMKLLARLAHTKAVEVAVATDQPTVQDYAREVGLKVFGSVQAAQWQGWISPQAPLASVVETLPQAVEPLPSPLNGNGNKPVNGTADGRLSLKQKPKKYKVVNGSGRVGIFQQFGYFILTGLLAIAVVLGMLMLWPQSTVTLIPVAQEVSTDLVVKGDPEAKSVDFRTLTFPARVAQVDMSLTGQIETNAAEFAPAGIAKGNVTFINRTEMAQVIPFSTTLLASAGEQIEFRTLVTAAIPPGLNMTTVVPVIASKPGLLGNVGTGQINRFAESNHNVVARVINEFALGGGTLEMKKVVVQADKARLQAHLEQKLKDEGLKRLQQTLGEQEFISPDTIQVIPLAVTYKEFAGDVSDTFSGEMKAAVRGTVVGGYNANRLAMAALEAQVPPGFKLYSKGLHFGAGEVLESTKGVVSFRIVAKGLVVSIIDPPQVAQDIAWLSIGEAQELLSQQYRLATVSGVELQPTWLMDRLGRLPFAPLRINVIIKDAVVLNEE